MRHWMWLALVALVACDEGGFGEGGEGGEGGSFGTGGTSVDGGGACSTGSTWKGGEGATMQPGGDCIGCHTSGEGPRFTLAGTVMGDYDDATGCNGIDGVQVHVTDANGTVRTLTTNAAGNFFSTAAIAMPYTIELEYMGSARAMGAPQSTGDCVSCHTASGSGGAPGRIIAP